MSKKRTTEKTALLLLGYPVCCPSSMTENNKQSIWSLPTHQTAHVSTATPSIWSTFLINPWKTDDDNQTLESTWSEDVWRHSIQIHQTYFSLGPWPHWVRSVWVKPSPRGTEADSQPTKGPADKGGSAKWIIDDNSVAATSSECHDPKAVDLETVDANLASCIGGVLPLPRHPASNWSRPARPEPISWRKKKLEKEKKQPYTKLISEGENIPSL